MYRVYTDKKTGKRSVKAQPNETDAQRTERLMLTAILNGLFARVDMVGHYRVDSTSGSHQYEVKWLRTLRCWGCSCEGYLNFGYKYPACPCIHVATVLLDIGTEPVARTIAEMAARMGAAIYSFHGTYQIAV